mgnify:CR=1 FL=1
MLIRNHQILVKFHLISQTKAVGAGSKGIVKGKASWLHLLDTDSAVGTGEIHTELNPFPSNHIHQHQTV